MPLWNKKSQSNQQNGDNQNGTPQTNGDHHNGRTPVGQKQNQNGTLSNRTASPKPQNGNGGTVGIGAEPLPVVAQLQKPKLVFHCQQAQGSPTGIISGFTNIKELYSKIADCYDFPASEILFCTLNTHKIDMSRLLGGQIGLDDFIFAHRKGQAKEVQLMKTEEALGLTITDNSAGYAFIKRIREGSVMERAQFINVGDHIERIDQASLVGRRHVEVAKLLKDIPKGATFTMRLVEPLRAGFANIGPRNGPGGGKKPMYGTGRETLRLRATGPATVEQAPDDLIQAAVDKINSLLENFLGINDVDLAIQIWELGQGKQNTMEFAEAIDGSDLGEFSFTDDFVFDLWGVISDAKAGRLKSRG